ncbi:tyrosine-protein kinase receptor Tie-2-like [Anneissia japonica]|uniref:tyrosine-protein kinase receptor Tie-2-like n=1 Tax=Anneissia japonica TaxID=1529436 RepID=UPI0014258F08|nr:tyrosine-protein kinase receptor Tie-2-like [Anneissia japonica]
MRNVLYLKRYVGQENHINSLEKDFENSIINSQPMEFIDEMRGAECVPGDHMNKLSEQLIHGCAANPYLTVFNVQSAFNNIGQLQCYPTNSSTIISMGKLFKISNTDSLAEPPLKDKGAYPYAKDMYIPYDGNFFGVYYCKGVLNGETTIVKTTVVNLEGASDSDVTPTNEKTSITASVGESVTVSFDVRASSNHIWRKNGELLDNYEKLYDHSSLNFTSVKVDDGGMYELYIDGQRDEYNHSFIELIVKECPTGHWGAPGCTGICNNCYNGGVCEDKKGNCICAPGFKGESCEDTCGGNQFGLNCEYRCTRSYGYEDRCRGNHYCLPNPYGCNCITGFTGLDCLTDCDSGKFGAGCSQECHCTSGSCNQYTGECASGTCATGWSGSNCQVPSTCPVGYFSTSCTSICHCHDNFQCDKNTGVCSNGLCAIGYHTYDNLFCEACQSGSYGYYCAFNCNCDSASCHQETGCNGGCLNNWLLNSCTTGITASSNTRVNPGQMSTFQCDIEGDVTNVTIQFLQVNNNQLATETGRTESNGVTRVTFTSEANVAVPYVCRLATDSYTAYAEHSLNIFDDLHHLRFGATYLKTTVLQPQ